jgi:hypothetical protein
LKKNAVKIAAEPLQNRYDDVLKSGEPAGFQIAANSVELWSIGSHR